MPFKTGDRVTWTSQANGRTVEKTGEVIEVVPAGKDPKTKIHGAGLWRQHESYVVHAVKDTKSGKKTAIYWPIVSLLKPAYEVFNDDALRKEIIRVWGEFGAHIEVFDSILIERNNLRKNAIKVEDAAPGQSTTIQTGGTG
jgi:hypothetical protein